MEFSKGLAEKGLKYLNQTEEFIAEQVPDYLNQVVQWNFYECLTDGAINIFVIVVCVAVVVFCYKGLKKNIEKDGCDMESAAYSSVCVIGLTFLIINLAYLPSNIKGCVKSIYAPKVYLVEYFTRMINK